MNGNDGCPAVGVPKEMMAAFDPDDLESDFTERGNHLASGQPAEGADSRGNGDPLNADEIQGFERLALRFEAELNGLSNAFYEFVERSRLSVAAPQRGYCTNVPSLGIALDHHVKLTLHPRS